MKTTRPLELLYFTGIPLKTDDDEIMCGFFAIDDFSEFAFNLGTVDSLDELTILKAIISITQHEDFINYYEEKEFTVMIPFELGQTAKDAINQYLDFHNGKIVYNKTEVDKNVKPFMDSIRKL